MPGPEHMPILQTPEPSGTTQGRLTNEEFQVLRQQYKINYTRSVLSHIITDNMKKLKLHPRKSKWGHGHGRGHLPGGVSFDAVLGIDPSVDNIEKDRQAIEIHVNWFRETVDRLWGQQLNQLREPNERQIVKMCQELEGMGIKKQQAVEAVYKHYGIQIPDKPDSVIAA